MTVSFKAAVIGTAVALTGLVLDASQVPATAVPSIAALAWMSGSWAGTTSGVEMEEHWTAAKGGSMIGIHRDVVNGLTASFEFLEIRQASDGVVYVSSPNRGPSTPFRLVEASGSRVVFENPTHDYPQRIIYWKDGMDLRARIEGAQDGKLEGEEWRWRPATLK